jgi:hypothetical protein
LLNQACAVTATQLEAFRLQGAAAHASKSSTVLLSQRLAPWVLLATSLLLSVTAEVMLTGSTNFTRQAVQQELVLGPASLALAAMQLGAQYRAEQPGSYSSSGSGSSNSSSGSGVGSNNELPLSVVTGLSTLAANTVKACCPSFRDELLAGVQMPAALAQLLSLHFAALTALQHSKAAATAAESGAEQQQQEGGCAVPAHHLQLLQQLPHWERLLAGYEVRMLTGAAQQWEVSMESALELVPAMQLQLPQWQRGALLRVLVEASTLCCGRLPLQLSVLEGLAAVLVGLGDATCIVQRSSSSGRIQPGPAQRAGVSERLQAVQAAALLRPVLHQVAGAVLHTLRLSTAPHQATAKQQAGSAGSAGAAEGLDLGSDAQQLKTVQGLACVVIWVASADELLVVGAWAGVRCQLSTAPHPASPPACLTSVLAATSPSPGCSPAQASGRRRLHARPG